MTIGNRISQLRKNKGYTQEHVAQALGVSRQAVFKWEQDQSRPDTANLIALAELLGTSTDYLLQGKTATKSSARSGSFFRASLFPLILMPLCWILGILIGAYTDMAEISVRQGVRIGIPFLMYGRSPLAIILVVVSIVCFFLFVLMLFWGHQANKD